MARQLIILTLLSFLLSSCDFLDFKGMVATYTDVDERFETSIAWNEMHASRDIISTDDDYTLFIMSDSHLGGTKNITEMYDAARADSAEAVLMIGDLCSGNEEDYDTLNVVINRYSDIPSLQVIGNHDLYFEGWEYYYNYFGSSTYYFSVTTPNDSDLFIMLDTGGGTLGEIQLQWFKDVLESKRSNYRNCTVLTHNNLIRSRYTISTQPMQEEVKMLLDLFLKYEIDYCIAGHDHKYDAFTFGNTHYIVTDALLDGYKDAAYLKFNTKDGTISVSHHPVSE